VSGRFLAVVNPAAGGGRCGKLAATAIERLRSAGLELDVVWSRAPGDATRLAREAYAQGLRKFIAVGGDGTCYEIVNGLFPEAANHRATVGFLPLGTGNSFLRDFPGQGADYTIKALLAGRSRACDVLRLTHRHGVIYFTNLLSIGFAADVTALTNRKFKRLGELGYLLGVLTCLARLDRRTFPVRVDDDAEFDRRRCLFLSFNNSKFTGGKMMIAPLASTDDGLVEVVRWGPIGRLGLLRNLHTLYDGSHLAHPLASRRAARRVEFDLEGPKDVMVDGEVLTLECQTLEVLPAALDVLV
jgi:diacylglycerol kinase (ATP)